MLDKIKIHYLNILDKHKNRKIQSGKVVFAYLQFVLVGPVIFWKFAEFFCQMEALTNIFRWDKIKCNLVHDCKRIMHVIGIYTSLSSIRWKARSISPRQSGGSYYTRPFCYYMFYRGQQSLLLPPPQTGQDQGSYFEPHLILQDPPSSWCLDICHVTWLMSNLPINHS